MSKLFIFIGIITLATVSFGWGGLPEKSIDFSYYSTSGLDLYYDVPQEIEPFAIDKKIKFPFLGKSYVGFREAIGFKESQGNYFVINHFGYMGKYQFGRSTLKMIGIYDTGLFMKDPKLQETAFNIYTSRNKGVLKRYIKRYAGKYVNGVFITESGILAAAHLAGPGNVKRFLRSGGSVVFQDAFGTSVKYYLKKFSGYDTSHIVPNKKAKFILKS